MGKRAWLVIINYVRLFETEKRLKVTSSQLFCKNGNMSETLLL